MKTPKILVSLLFILFSGHLAFGQSNMPIETIIQQGHSRHISCIAYSPDGKYIVTGSVDNTLKLWNSKTAKEIRTFSQHENAIQTVCFSPDGKYILSTAKDNKAIVYDITSGKPTLIIEPNSGRLFKASYSPDGSKILSMNDRTEVILWDAKSGIKIKSFKKNYTSIISSEWFSQDGKMLLSYFDSKNALLTDLVDSLKTIKLNIEKAVSFAISPNGRLIAIGSNKKNAKLFLRETGKELFLLDANKEKPCDGCKTFVSFSHSGKYLATASKYAGLTIWNVKNGAKIKQFNLEDDWIDGIAFSPNDNYILVSAGDNALVWNIKSEEKMLDLSFNGVDCIPAFSSDSKSLVTPGDNNTAALWNIEQGRKIKSFQGYLNKQNYRNLNFKEGNLYHSNILRFLSYLPKTTLSPNGKYLVITQIDSSAIVLNTATGKIKHILKGHSKLVLTANFSKDGKRLITGSGDRTIKLWDIESGKVLRTFKGHTDLIFDVKFSSDDKYIVSGSWDGSMRVWETNTGKSIKYIDFDNASPYTVGFTPKDLYLYSGDLGKEFKFFEVDASKEFRNIIGHTNLVTDVCFSPDGKTMVSASLDGMVKVWDVLSGMLVNKFDDHNSGVLSIAYHPNKNYILSGGNDRTIKIWDSNTGELIKNLDAHSSGVSALSISANGKYLVSSSIAGIIKIWDLENFKELYSYIQIDRDNWLAKNPEGYFDGTAEALKNINYVSGLNVIPVGSLFEKYYSPNLIKRIQAGEEFTDANTDINNLVKNTTDIQLRIISSDNLRDFEKIDSINWYNDTISISAFISDKKTGIDEVRYYNNGKLISNKKYNNTKNSKKGIKESIPIILHSGENIISAVAFNKERTETQANNLKVYYDGIESDINLYVMSIGIDDYLNPSLKLNYALDDAKAYSKIIRKNANSMFQSIEEYFLKDDEANKEEIQKTLREIAKKSGPEDVFIFYFAGHGAMSIDNSSKPEFFIIPYDVTKIYGSNDELKEKAISADELLSLSQQIAARKQLFILDACQSGGALEAFNTRGADREKAIAQLARSTGTFFLLASGAIQFASEAKDLEHGIFTYAILEGLNGKADGGTLDEKITANELKSYVEDRVPELTDKYMLTPQYPTGYSFGQDFPIVIVK